jgi:hypothetical protein
MNPVTRRLKTQQVLEDDKIYQLLSDCYQAVDKGSELFDRIGDELSARWDAAERTVVEETKGETFGPGDR